MLDTPELAPAAAASSSSGHVSLSRAYSPLRHGNFAAMIPGDSAVVGGCTRFNPVDP